MAQFSGCGCLLVLLALGVLLANWPLFLALVLLFLLLVFVTSAVLEHNMRQLKQLVQQADRRVRNEPCRVRDHFGVIQSLSVAGDLATPGIEIRCRIVAGSGDQLEAKEECISFSPPTQPQQLRSVSGITHWVKTGGITLLEDLSVEAKAARAAMECLRERAWSKNGLGKMEEIKTSVIHTLAKAEGNELLESSIPQLQEALRTFEAEHAKLQLAHDSADEMLRKLHDFLSVPDDIRPILNFDLDQLYDPQRFADLKQSFSEVVLLNDTFRELSRDALA
jgi:hypothetical protein